MTLGDHHGRANLALEAGRGRVFAVGLEDDFVNAAGLREPVPVAADNVCGGYGVADVELCLDEGRHVVEVLDKVPAEAYLLAQFLCIYRN